MIQKTYGVCWAGIKLLRALLTSIYDFCMKQILLLIDCVVTFWKADESSWTVEQLGISMWECHTIQTW